MRGSLVRRVTGIENPRIRRESVQREIIYIITMNKPQNGVNNSIMVGHMMNKLRLYSLVY